MPQRQKANPGLPKVPARELFGTDRLELRGCLGGGGFGVVYLVHDLERDAEVAVKALHQGNPEAVMRFKREFRALQDLTHPNLVHLLELFEHGGRWFLEMEHVPGENLLEHVRPGGTLDEGRLREALAQLSQGLGALHDASLVHRDIKPENIRVSDRGRVVLLDFGLVEDTPGADDPALFLGTAAYAAPEQITGGEVGPPADWYAVGVVLYEALTGTRPFDDADLAQLASDKTRGLYESPLTRDPSLPHDLCELCVALLLPRPAARPDGAEVLARLDQDRATNREFGLSIPTAQTRHGGPTRFVGRDRELEALRRALEASRAGELTVVYLEGESGVGKTALVQRFTDELQGSDALVLKSRCHERETVPYNAFDGAVEGLARALSQLEATAAAALLPTDAPLLLHLFPVLGGVASLRERWAEVGSPADPARVRASAFRALRQLLYALATRQPVVLTIDDAQWADAESLVLLDELLRPPDAPGILLLAAGREVEDATENVAAAVKRWERAAPRFERRRLDRLSFEAARTLALRLLRPRHRGQADAVARESGGHPLFIEALVQYGELNQGGVERLEHALAFFVEQLDPASRRLLQLVALAGTPLSQRTAGEAAGLDAAEATASLAKLRVARLLRVRRGADLDAVAIFHEQIRRAAVAQLEPQDKRALHGRLAAALQQDRRVDLEVLADHWAQAGRRERAAQCALRAAKRAADSLAFARAARLYGWALSLHPEQERAQTVRVERAHALSRANRCSEAADAYLEAGRQASNVDGIELRRRAAEHLLRSERFEEGLDVARQLLRELGTPCPTSARAAQAQLRWLRLQRKVRGVRFQQRTLEDIAPAALARVDALFAVASCLEPLRPAEAAALHARHLLQALDVGEPGRVALALCVDAQRLYLRGDRRRARRRLARARALAEQSHDLATRAMQQAAEGALRWLLELDPRGAAARTRDAELALMDRCADARWLLDQTRRLHLVASADCGDPAPLLARYPQLLGELRERGDAHAQADLSLAAGVRYHLLRDEPEEASRCLIDAQALWAHTDRGQAELDAHIMRLRIARYRDQRGGARRYLDSWRALQQRGWTGAPHLEALAHLASARALLDLVEHDHEARHRHLREAEDALHQAARWGYRLPAARLLRAELLALAARPAAALEGLRELLADAPPQLTAQHAQLLAARLEGGAQDARSRREAVEAALAASGARAPAAYLRAYGGF